MIHVMKFFEFVINRRGVVELKGIDAPPTHWDSPLAAFEATLAHEEHVTSLIHKLVELAVAEHDHPCHVLLEWFVSEQVEEEAVADQIVQRLKMAGDAPAALLMIDAELAARALAPPSTAT
jgi:ferritin